MSQDAGSSSLATSSFNDYNAQLQATALKATKQAVSLPSDIAFYRSLGKDLAKEVDACSGRVLSVTNKLLDLVSTSQNTNPRGRKRQRLESDDDVIDSFQSLVVDAMDQLLENTDMRLDEFLGLSKPPTVAVSNTQRAPPKTKRINVPQGRLDPALQHASRLPKPQSRFKRKVDNSTFSIWQPTLRHKYNAQVPLGYDFHEEGEDEPTPSYHPYRYEVKNIQYPPSMFEFSEPIAPKSFEETPFIWVDARAEFNDMLAHLRDAKELAIDLEYHSYRSFAGFVCLMQISTRKGDWIIDTLAVREELEELNEVFTDPNIIKVLHGAESDIVWLQQDFNLYIVNLFDTYHASKVLDFPKHGLATLLEMYCDFVPDKRYQLADWRIRPLPQEMLHYARSDTHFLLFIYDNLRNALLDRSSSRAHSPNASSDNLSTQHEPATPAAFMHEVLSRSQNTALRVYEKEAYDADGGSGPGGWDTLARKWNKGPFIAGQSGGMRMDVYKCIHAWRDRIAREEDESTRYVLPNHYLFMLAENPPADMAAFLNFFQSVPPVLRRRARELLDAIRETVKQHLTALSGKSQSVASQEETITTSTKTTGGPSSSNSQLASVDSRPLFEVSTTSTTTSSSLFGNTLKVASEVKQNRTSLFYMTSRSALFSTSVKDAGGHLILPEERASRFQDILTRIHSGLAVAPTVTTLQAAAMPNSSSSPTVEADVEMTSATTPVSQQAEVPYVPSAQRQKALSVVEDDSIVVVGQARKKRKRTSKKNATNDANAVEGTSTPDPEPFDFETAPNILDEGSDHEPTDLGRKKRQKGQARIDYGNFKAPPKAHSQPKTGNQSQTFR